MAGAPSFPRSLPEFQRTFPDDEACVRYLFRLRWPDGKACGTGCEGDYAFYRGGKVVFCKACRKTISLTAGTILHKTHTPLCTWFYAAYLVTTLTPGISAIQLQHQLGIKRYETAFQILHKLRSAMVNLDREPLGGTVEMDETYVGGAQTQETTGRSTQGRTLVVGAVEVLASETGTGKRAGRVRFRTIPAATAQHLEAFAKDQVARGAAILTDGWRSYSQLRALGYDHRPTVEGRPENAAKILPLIHREFSNLKTWLHGTHHGRVERQHLQAYLNEFVFRHNRRFWRFSAFQRVLQIGLTRRSPTYDELYETNGYGRSVHLAETEAVGYGRKHKGLGSA